MTRQQLIDSVIHLFYSKGYQILKSAKDFSEMEFTRYTKENKLVIKIKLVDSTWPTYEETLESIQNYAKAYLE